ncbi:DsbA family oxidoreductase [Actinoplanes solisilvae]|uniref:DsbA family oxidoreductase n=1 Tax=Actinoplanes solisilvae TaxID=2486853 RepID=UPI000FDB9C92|nr:DsbA family oxidoreductase [Actinoplanes solisilvae]
MDIQVWSDVVCPWCYLGKRRLEAAIAQFGGDVTVTFRAFQLDPSRISEGRPAKEVAAAKFGEQVGQRYAHVTALGAGEGLRFDFDRAITANTFDSHRLIAWAAGQERQAEMLEALQRAHFSDGLDLGSHKVLASVAWSIGLDAAAAGAYLSSEAGTGAVHADLAEARELGISSVPFFVIDGKYAVQGAQETSSLVSALHEIARREAVDAGR